MNKWKWYVYVAECKNGLYYTGMTYDLSRRMEQHSLGLGSRFTARHGFRRLVYTEEFDDILEARYRERQVKDYRREKKQALWNG